MNRLFPKTKLTELAKTGKYNQGWFLSLVITVALFVIGMLLQAGVGALIRFPIGAFTAGNQALYDAWTSVGEKAASGLLIVLVLVYLRVIEKRKPQTIGFRGPTPAVEYIVGFAIGLALMAVCVFANVLMGNATFDGTPQFSWILLPLLCAFLLQGMSEEVLCRGFLLHKFAARYAPIVGILVNSMFFMVLHLLNPNVAPLPLINIVVFGVFASLYIWKRGNIWGISALHSAWNFAQGNLFGVAVSGQAPGYALFHTTFSERGTLFSGGSFGIEGGLMCTIVFAVGIVILLFLPVRREARIEQ